MPVRFRPSARPARAAFRPRLELLEGREQPNNLLGVLDTWLADWTAGPTATAPSTRLNRSAGAEELPRRPWDMPVVDWGRAEPANRTGERLRPTAVSANGMGEVWGVATAASGLSAATGDSSEVVTPDATPAGDRVPQGEYGRQPLPNGTYIIHDFPGTFFGVATSGERIFAAASGGQTMRVVGYDREGVPNPAFGVGGIAAPELGPGSEYSNSLTVLPDGRILVAGHIERWTGENWNHDLGLTRLTAAGAVDATFGGGTGYVNFNVPVSPNAYDDLQAVGVQSVGPNAGKVVVAGSSMDLNVPNGLAASAAVARFTADGAIDAGAAGFGQVSGGSPQGFRVTNFAPVSNGFRGQVVQPDDKLVAVGHVSFDGNNIQAVVARYTANGDLDPTFSGDGYLTDPDPRFTGARSAAVQADGRIVVVGTGRGADGRQDFTVVRYMPDGTRDATFGSGGYAILAPGGTGATESGYGVAIQPDGRIVVGGLIIAAGQSQAEVMVARLNTNGTLDTGFGVGGYKFTQRPTTDYHDFRGYSLALQTDARSGTPVVTGIVVAGVDFQGTTGNSARPLLVRFPVNGSHHTSAGDALATIERP